MSVAVQLLGSLEVGVDGVEAIPRAHKPRQLFALLALNHRRTVTKNTIFDELWGVDLPKSAHTTLQTYVLQLRKKLESVTDERGRGMITTRQHGYALVLPEDAVFDLERYQELAAQAKDEFRRGDDMAGLGALQEALSLWRGDALADVPRGRFLDSAVAGLEQSRLALIEWRQEAALDLGLHQAVLSELAQLVAEHRYNENLHAVYMIALHRSGIRDKALGVYQQLRSGMVEALGVEPSRELQRLFHALLVADPRLDEPPVRAWLRGRGQGRPHADLAQWWPA
jgi:DNA-binding SARP family transcriptional activator